MPYSGPDDATLPDNVKKLSAKLRGQWVSVFNRTLARCQAGKLPPPPGGAPKGQTCEGRAFAVANGVARGAKELEEAGELLVDGVRIVSASRFKELPMGDEEEKQVIVAEGEPEATGQKMGDMAVEVPPGAHVEIEVDRPKPFDGATTFADVDAYREASMREGAIEGLQYDFRTIFDNIMSDDEMTLDQKAAAVKTASTELGKRVASPTIGQKVLDAVKHAIFGEGEDEDDARVAAGEKATKREAGKDFPASDYAYVPDANKPSTWKLRLTSTPGGAPDSGIVGAAAAALGKGFRGQKVQIPAADLSGVKAKVRAAWRKANPDKKAEEMPAAIKEFGGGAFFAFKDVSGEYRWLAIATNKFEDREGEIFPEAAHKEYVEYVDESGDYPELRLWHVPNAGIGIADFVAYSDGFRIDSGMFYDGFKDVAERLAHWSNPLGISHGYRYRLKEKVGGVYGQYRTFEDTIVPFERAANPWTEFTAERAKEVLMPLAPDKRAFLVQVLGEDRTKTIEDGLPKMEKALEETGLGWKDVAPIAEALGSEGAAPAAPAAQPAPAEGAPQAAAPAPEPKAEGEQPPPDGEKPPSGGEEDETAKALKDIAAGQKAIDDRLTAMEADITALKRTDEEKITAAITPTGVKVLGATRPSDDPNNVVDAEKTAEITGGGNGADSPAKGYVDDLIRQGAVGMAPLPKPSEQGGQQ